MLLQIKIKKGHHCPSTITCKRKDGSSTYAQLPLDYEIHDISHYVIEKQLQLKKSFYGLLSEGYEIRDFMLPITEKPMALQAKNLPIEAIATEHLVNLVTLDYMQPKNTKILLRDLENILNENNLNFPVKVTEEKIRTIRTELAVLMIQWKKLPYNATIEMILKL